MPVVLRGELECHQWRSAAPDQVETIQARVLPTDALEIVPYEEAAELSADI